MDPWGYDASLYGQPDPQPAPKVRGARWGFGAAFCVVMVVIGLPLWIVLAIWFDSTLPPPPPEGDGPEEGWHILIFMFAWFVWTIVWIVLALVCGVVGAVQARRSRRAQREAPPVTW